MRLSAEQYFALDQMGIPVWVKRPDKSVQATETLMESSDFEQVDVTKSWLVITENALSVAENRLLRAVFASINVQLDDVAVLEPQHLKALERCSADTIVLVLGERLSQKLNLTAHDSLSCQQLENKLLALVAPSLQQLLEQPQRKFDMWQTIIQLRNLKAHQLD